MRRTLTTALALLVLVAGAALAQPGPGGDQSTPPPVMRKEMRIEKTLNMPQLTDEQQQKMDAARIAHLREVLPIQTDLEVKQMELSALWRADKLDAGKILAKVREINEARGRLAVAMANHRIAMANILTPEQRKAMGPMQGMGGMGRGMMRRGMGQGMMRGMMDQPGACPMGECGPGQCGGACEMD